MNYSMKTLPIFCVLATVLLVTTTSTTEPERARNGFQVQSNETWLTIHKNDTIYPNNGTVIVRDKRTNARNMWVFASRFTYTKAIQAVKVKVKTSGKPSVSLQQPLVVSVRSEAGGHTFNIPDAAYAKNGSVLSLEDTATRVLCPQNIGQDEHMTVSVSTGYLDPKDVQKSYTFNIEFIPIGHWSLDLNAPLQLESQPSEPAIYSFTWPSDAPETVMVSVKSINSPGVCSTVAVQHRTCPIAPTVQEITIDSKYITMLSSAAVTVQKSEFPEGFYVIVLPLVSDRPCDASAPAAAAPGRKKTIEVTVTPRRISRSYLAVPPLVALVLILAGCISPCLVKRNLRTPLLDIIATDNVEERERQRSSSTTDTDELVLDSGLGLRTSRDFTQSPQLSAKLSAACMVIGAALLLQALGGHAAFLGRYVQNLTGDLDVCYRNELCDFTIGGVASANHILARLPYFGAALGLLIAVQVQKRAYASSTADGTVDMGLAHDFGLLDSVWMALFVQGGLSMVYSVCPSPRIAELDVVFLLFILASLASKLYQGRRGITTCGHYVPLVMTGLMLAVGAVLQSTRGAWYMWLVLAIFHVMIALIVSAQLYVIGAISFTPGALKRVWSEFPLAVESPNHAMNRATSIIAVLANIGIAIAGIAARVQDLEQYVAIFLVVHAIIYITYYLLIKLVGHKEAGVRPAIFLLVSGVLLLLSSVIVCGINTFSTSLSPSASRMLNRSCMGASTLDVHDLWHILMAPSLLCLSLGVILLDDDLMMTPRGVIDRF